MGARRDHTLTAAGWLFLGQVLENIYVRKAGDFFHKLVADFPVVGTVPYRPFKYIGSFSLTI